MIFAKGQEDPRYGISSGFAVIGSVEKQSVEENPIHFKIINEF